MNRIIKSGSDWTFDDLYWMNDEIEKVAKEIGGYDFYENQVEVISAEQMLDAYASIGMPIFYNHWSFGKHFLKNKSHYTAGWMGLAYEIVINSNPCIVYIMESNTMLMQALVIAHAGIGHNHFFKNNYLFKERTNARNIIDYLEFSKKFIAKCEEKYGVTEVEKLLDAAHSLMNHSVFRYPRKEPLSLQKEMDRKAAKLLQEEKDFNPIWRTLPEKEIVPVNKVEKIRQEHMKLPEENILYFVETYSPKMPKWKREVLRIVRNICEYFYPQGQTKVMNEGCATWTHYEILNRLYEKNLVDDGGMLEFISSHSSVVTQVPFDHPAYRGLNPYSIGFEMMRDIIRISNEPTEEDKYWFPYIAGCKDGFNVLKDAWSNYRDESFIRQFLSPKLIRDYKMFAMDNKVDEDFYVVKHIHDEKGYSDIRQLLADDYDIAHAIPEINIIDADLEGDRILKLEYRSNKKKLHKDDAVLTLKHLANLWGYSVRLNLCTSDGTHIDTLKVSPDEPDKVEEDETLDNLIWY